MAYGVQVRDDQSLDAFLDFGDNFPLTVTCFEDEDLAVPSNLTGKSYILGIEAVKGGTSICEIPGIVVGNVITFPIYYSAYAGKAIEGIKYKFDYWETTNRLTEVPMSDVYFRAVAHKPVVEE